jgi:phospholipase/carboxylesterase
MTEAMSRCKLGNAVRAIIALLALLGSPSPSSAAIEQAGKDLVFRPSSTPANPGLLVVLHGAGQEPIAMMNLVEAEAERRGLVVFAPKSSGPTWDVITLAQEDQSGHDFRVMKSPFSRSGDAMRLRKAIGEESKRLAIDPGRIAILGFSDGATMALALGLDRRLTASSVLAFAPGMSVMPDQIALRRVVIAHGRNDKVIPMVTDCMEIVRPLRDQGVDVQFRPFDGGHDVPLDVLHEALDSAFGPAPGDTVRLLAVERCDQ